MSEIDGQRLLQEVLAVCSDMSIYPAAVQGFGDQRDYKERDGFKNGWNACVMEYGAKIEEAAERSKQPFSEPMALLLAADVGHLSGEVFYLNMNDTWAWGCADIEEVPADQLAEVARLFSSYGNCGLLYWVGKQRGGIRSEFYDNNRAIEFVEHEERIRREVPNYNKRAYHKESYKITGARASQRAAHRRRAVDR